MRYLNASKHPGAGSDLAGRRWATIRSSTLIALRRVPISCISRAAIPSCAFCNDATSSSRFAIDSACSNASRASLAAPASSSPPPHASNDSAILPCLRSSPRVDKAWRLLPQRVEGERELCNVAESILGLQNEAAPRIEHDEMTLLAFESRKIGQFL